MLDKVDKDISKLEDISNELSNRQSSMVSVKDEEGNLKEINNDITKIGMNK